MLDVTTNPLIALYFACEAANGEDGQVLVIEADKNSSKFYLSDTISCKCNLAHLTLQEKQELNEIIEEHSERVLRKTESPTLPVARSFNPLEYRKFLEDFNRETTVSRLVAFIKEEKPYFEPRIDPIDLVRVEMSHPRKNNARILAQSGGFIVFGLIEEFTESSSDHLSTYAISIPRKSKEKILEALSYISIDEGVVYPEIDRSASALKRHFRR